MGLAGNQIDLKGELYNLLAHALKSKARLSEEVVSIDGEFGQTVEVERTFRYSPHDGEALQLYSRVTLLGGCQTLRSAMDDLEML